MSKAPIAVAAGPRQTSARQLAICGWAFSFVEEARFFGQHLDVRLPLYADIFDGVFPNLGKAHPCNIKSIR